jgi:hypothetical protein
MTPEESPTSDNAVAAGRSFRAASLARTSKAMAGESKRRRAEPL